MLPGLEAEELLGAQGSAAGATVGTFGHFGWWEQFALSETTNSYGSLIYLDLLGSF